MADRRTPPWRKSPSRASRRRGSIKLTPAEKAAARQRAAKAGRRYPNLIDNMTVARRRRKARKHGQTP